MIPALGLSKILLPVVLALAFADSVSVGKVASIDATDGARMVSVEIKGDKGTRQAVAGSELWAGDHVLAGAEASVVLMLRDGSEVVLAPDSEISLDEVADKAARGASRLGLLRGLLHAIVNKIYTSEQPFMVQAGNCVMGVRGTEFVADREANGQATLHTLVGSVAIARSVADLKVSKATQLVRAGSSSLMQAGMQLPAAPRKFNPKTLDDYLGHRAPRVARVVTVRRAARNNLKHIEEAKKQGPSKKKVIWTPPKPKRTKGK